MLKSIYRLILLHVKFNLVQFCNASQQEHTRCHALTCTLLSLFCAGTQPGQQFYDTSLFSPASGPFSVNNCSLIVSVLPTNDPPVIDVVLPGVYLNKFSESQSV